MAATTSNLTGGLRCQGCGYDLRAQAEEARCPECGLTVARSRELEAIPRRPAWRDSDPRWRRRILAGIWLLTLLPLMDVLLETNWASEQRAPALFDYPGGLMLDETLLASFSIYASVVFCMGLALLFSRERGRRRHRLDWTSKWGVLCSYATMLLWAVNVMLVGALTVAGISAVFLSIPPPWQPGVTPMLTRLSTVYLRYGPYPKSVASGVLVIFSSVGVMLACIPLFGALRSCGPKWLAIALLAPLPAFGLMNLSQAIRSFFSPTYVGGGLSDLWMDVYGRGIYFRPEMLPGGLFGERPLHYMELSSFELAFVIESIKWCVVAVIAIWLTMAQFAAVLRRSNRRPK